MPLPEHGYIILDKEQGLCGPRHDAPKFRLEFFDSALSSLAHADFHGLTRRFMELKPAGASDVNLGMNHVRCMDDVSLPEFLKLCTGTAKVYNKDGKVVRETTYVAGVKNGEEIDYDADGVRVRASTCYKDGRMHGIRAEFNDDKMLVSVTTYEAGLRHGEHVLYHRNGRVAWREVFVRDQLHGPRTTYAENGVMLRQDCYARGLLEGWEKWYDHRGVLYQAAHYQKGRLHGKVKKFNSKGKLVSCEVFVADKRQGKYTRHHDSGRVADIAHYEGDKMTGRRELFRANGQRSEIQYWLNGELHGLRRIYNDKGRKIESCRYQSGKKHGPFTRWDPITRRVSVRGEYNNDAMVRCWEIREFKGVLPCIVN